MPRDVRMLQSLHRKDPPNEEHMLVML